MTRRKREASEDEIALFRETIGGARPANEIASTAGIPDKTASKPAAAKATAKSRPSGVDGRTAERLRRGQLEPEARLDLHGLTEARAHARLAGFLKSAQAQGHRLVLVVTGKGAAASDPHAPFDLELEGRSRGVLKTMVPRWLREPELAPIVAEVRPAHRRHGGGGALYVYLRKRTG